MSLPPSVCRHVPVGFPSTATLLVLVGLVAGCSPSPRDQAPPIPPSPPLAHSGSSAPPAAPPVVATDLTIPDGAILTMDALVRCAAAHNPTRDVFEATRAVAAAEVLSAQAWSNPELEVSGGRAKARDGSGNENIHGVDLRQRFELPGKRSSRIDAAMAGQTLAEYEVAVDALALASAVRAACLELSAAEVAYDQAQAAFATAQQVHQTIKGRAMAGESASGDVARASLELVLATAARDQAQRQVDANRAAVRVWAGGGLPEHFTVSDALPVSLPQIERSSALATAAARNPQLGLLRAQLNARGADLAREQRAWQPDVTVGAFADRESDTDNLGLSLGVELPLWNRNQGGIAVATAQQRKALAQWRVEQQRIARDVDLAWQMYESRRLALGGMLNEAKTAADAALAAKLAAYAAGEASLLDVLDARRASQGVDALALDARRAAGEARLALGQAIGSFTITDTVSTGAQP